MSKHNEKPTPLVPAKFAIGEKVRVKSGLVDPDYPDVLMEGWAGTIAQIQEGSPVCYFVRWTQETIDSFRSIYRQWCERNGEDFETFWKEEDFTGMGLLEDWLEPDIRGPLGSQIVRPGNGQ